MEGISPGPDITSSAKTETPPQAGEVKTRPLSRGLRGIDQLQIIATTPTENQVKQLAEKLRTDNPAGKDPEIAARRNFENFNNLIQKRAALEQQIKAARAEAFSADSASFQDKLKAVNELKTARALYDKEINDFASYLKESGLELEGDQIPPTLGDKISQKTGEVRQAVGASRDTLVNAMSSGAETITTTVGAGAKAIGAGTEMVSQAVGTRIDQGKEIMRSGIESGRQTLRTLISTGSNALREARSRGQNAFDAVKNKVQEINSTTTEAVNTRFQAGIAWAEYLKAEMVDMANAASSTVQDLLEKTRTSASARYNQTIENMHTAGSKAKERWDQNSQAVLDFASSQLDRVSTLQRHVRESVAQEVRIAIEKGKLFITPALESVQRDRAKVREQMNIQGTKIGLMVEQISDLASPIIDRILDRGRDGRDAVLGFSNKHIEGMRVFGANTLGATSEKANVAWQAVTERWENLKLRGNESRQRVNLFLENALGPVGQRFARLAESDQLRTLRENITLPNVRIENGYIVRNGQRVSEDVEKYFAQKATSAKEYLTRNLEKAGRSVEAVKRYIDITAIRTWVESGLSNQDISRRAKLLRGIGAASLDRASRTASLATATGLELASSRSGRLALGTAALLFLMANNEGISQNTQQFLSDALANLPDINIGQWFDANAASSLGSVDASGSIDATNTMGSVDTTLVSPSLDTTISSTPDTGTAPPTNIPDTTTFSPDISSAPLDTPNIPETPASSPTTDTVTSTTPNSETTTASNTPTPTPENTSGPLNQEELRNFISHIEPGRPVEAQVRELAQTLPGNPTENYNNLLAEVFNQYGDNFRSTAQSIVDTPSQYAQDTVRIAQEQLQAIDQLKNQSLNPGTQEWFESIMKAMHYWRPA